MKELDITIRLEGNRANICSGAAQCDFWVKRHDLHGQVEALVNEWIGHAEERTCLECKNAALWTEYGQTQWDCREAMRGHDIEFRDDFYATCIDKGYGPEDTAGLCPKYEPGGAETLEGEALVEHMLITLPAFLKRQAE